MNLTVCTGDERETGFGVKVTSTGTVSWFLNYHLNGKERRIALGH